MAPPRGEQHSEGDPTGHQLPQPKKQGFVYWLGWILTRSISLVWLRLWPKGQRHIPRDGAVIFVANHQSHLDPPLLGSCSPRPVTFIARGTLASNSFMCWLLPRMGTLLVHRDAPAKSQMQTALNVLKQGGCIGVFPEGTRSTDGCVHEFRGGVEFLARRSRAKVVPVGIGGSGRSMGKGKSWPRPTKVSLRFGPPWDAKELKAPDALERLRVAVASLADAPLAEAANPTTSDDSAVAAHAAAGVENTASQDGPEACSSRSGAHAGSGRSVISGEGD